jgi:hypothetical protein
MRHDLSPTSVLEIDRSLESVSSFLFKGPRVALSVENNVFGHSPLPCLGAALHS